MGFDSLSANSQFVRNGLIRLSFQQSREYFALPFGQGRELGECRVRFWSGRVLAMSARQSSPKNS